MKLAVKSAWLCGTGMFVVLSYTSFLRKAGVNALNNGNMAGANALEAIGLSLVGAVFAAFLGYICGDILSKPKGNTDPKTKKSSSIEETGEAMSGNEVFLDDVEGEALGEAPINQAEKGSPELEPYDHNPELETPLEEPPLEGVDPLSDELPGAEKAPG